MPKDAWSAKRERQCAHIKGSLLERGRPEPLAKEIAAWVVEARQRGLKGRSSMNKVQLEAELTR